MSMPGSAIRGPQQEDNIALKTGASTPLPQAEKLKSSARSRKSYQLSGQPPIDKPPRDLFNRVTSFVDEKMGQIPSPMELHRPSEPSYHENNRFHNVKLMLINKVLEYPFFETPIFFISLFGIPENAFTLGSFLQLFQMAIQIATICLCAQSLKNDDYEIQHRIWAFLIAQSSIILAVATLFTFRVLRLGNNGAVLYSLVSACLAFAAFGVALGILMPTECTNEVMYCRMRRATTGLVSLSAFLWLMELVIFITIVYVARLNIIPDPNDGMYEGFVIPFSAGNETYPPKGDDHRFSGSVYPQSEITNVGEPHQFLKTPASLITPQAPMEIASSPEPPVMRRLIITEAGLEPVHSDSQLEGLKPIVLYANPEQASTEEAAEPQL
ncbi:hypothetical protein DASC09_063390 [Saccharomycopsis crataegensis]|uniref:Uncharacterized protein n=1 Tax=Saccharomycopsis crataegensis TaxID=43959 RepID=A0AAV5QWH9_9ASCO|nr:hypothetical protein DASC09_063390 [Saccharomycopsis crataegensis]